MKNIQKIGPLFQWAAHQEIRRPIPISPAARRVARHGRVSELHALAFCQANNIGGGSAR